MGTGELEEMEAIEKGTTLGECVRSGDPSNRSII
jgi:hypothetical protein